jgi:hypothetical protein
VGRTILDVVCCCDHTKLMVAFWFCLALDFKTRRDSPFIQDLKRLVCIEDMPLQAAALVLTSAKTISQPLLQERLVGQSV